MTIAIAFGFVRKKCNNLRSSWRSGTALTVDATVVGLIPTQENIYFFYNSFFFPSKVECHGVRLQKLTYMYLCRYFCYYDIRHSQLSKWTTVTYLSNSLLFIIQHINFTKNYIYILKFSLQFVIYVINLSSFVCIDKNNISSVGT